jgi:hypothetical protein
VTLQNIAITMQPTPMQLWKTVLGVTVSCGGMATVTVPSLAVGLRFPRNCSGLVRAL